MTDKTGSQKDKQPKRVSSAPPPITPLKGSGRVATIQRPIACPPEWSQWVMMDRVEVWEAAALSINLEPRRIDRDKNSSFPDDKTYDLFVMRRRAVEVAPWRALGRNQLGVCLPDFVEWSMSTGMDIPAELAKLARPIEAPEVPAPEYAEPSVSPINIQTAAEDGLSESDGSKQETKEGEIRKRSALIKEVDSFWPSVDRDLKDSSRNGLNEAAKHSKNTFWKPLEAMAWATERGKISKNKAVSFVASNPENALSPMLRHLLKLD